MKKIALILLILVILIVPAYADSDVEENQEETQVTSDSFKPSTIIGAIIIGSIGGFTVMRLREKNKKN